MRVLLIQFNFKNFKSFRDEAILDLTAVYGINDFSERVVSIGNEKLLPLAAIYGANASGKSNVYSAFKYMTDYVKSSLIYDDDDDFVEKSELTPFLFDSVSEKAESCFEVFFIIPNDPEEKCYNYGFCINHKRVMEEWLNIKTKNSKKYDKIFYRRSKDSILDLNGLAEDRRINIKLALDKKVLIVSLGARLKINECKRVREWFVTNRFANFADTIENIFLFSRVPPNFGEDKKIQAKVIDYLSTFDNNIRDFKVKRINDITKRHDRSYKIKSIHKKIDSSEMAEIPFKEESAGTLKMFALYPDLQHVLKSGGVFFVDELNARLHPLLVRNFILTFLNPEINTNHAQLIFTTHDTWLMKRKFLRGDEIWFTEKDDKGLSSLYSLADFSDLSDEDFETSYLLGEYGAIPSLTSIKKEDD